MTWLTSWTWPCISLGTPHWAPLETQHTRVIHPMLFQCWASVEDDGPTSKQHSVRDLWLLESQHWTPYGFTFFPGRPHWLIRSRYWVRVRGGSDVCHLVLSKYYLSMAISRQNEARYRDHVVYLSNDIQGLFIVHNTLDNTAQCTLQDFKQFGALYTCYMPPQQRDK